MLVQNFVQFAQEMTIPELDGHDASATGSAQHFSGTGSENLGTITVSQDSLLTWQCDTCTQTGMQIISDPSSNLNDINILQSATSGKTEVSADTYDNVQVDGRGRSRSRSRLTADPGSVGLCAWGWVALAMLAGVFALGFLVHRQEASQPRSP